jgi:16S rRNA G1207 methylase RsmC
MVEHYFSEKQESDDSRFEINVRLKNDNFKLISTSGIFSKKELDAATELLIENSVIGKKVLDLGCGYGVVGISILRKHKNAIVFFSDINERAIELTNENLKKLNLTGEVIKSNLFEKIDDKFDTILTNPPYAAGRALCFRLIEESSVHLEKLGTLQLVARHNKGGSVLEQKMKDVFGNVETLVKSGGFRVYISIKQ